MSETTVDYSKRPFQYYNIDGVGELGVGFMLLGFGSVIWLQLHAPKDSMWHQWPSFLVMGLICAIIHYGSRAVKQRITYPRTGFVEYTTRDRVWRPMILGMLVSGAISMALVTALRSHWDVKTLAALFLGLLFGASYAHGFARTVRWKWAVVAAMAVASPVIAMLPTELIESAMIGSRVTGSVPPALAGVFLIWFLFYGAILMISGGISFYLYLRNTNPPAQEA